MKKLSIILNLAAIFFLLGTCTAVASPSVRALYLPTGATIKPEGEKVLMVSRDGMIAATIVFGDRQRVAVWRNGKRNTLEIVNKHKTGAGPYFQTIGALAPDGKLYVNVEDTLSGAYAGIKYHTFVYQDGMSHDFAFPQCDLAGQPGDPIVEGIDAGRLAVTFQSPDLIQFFQVNSGIYAPSAAIIDSTGCQVIGRANLLAIRGKYAVGFRGYLDKALAPTNVNGPRQTYKAVLWDGQMLREMGDGIAFDISSYGVSVGATARPGVESVVNRLGIPHAVLWDTKGSSLILGLDGHSVAYAIDENGRVAGMLRDESGKHYAFIWEQGSMQRLDDLVQAPRWRFESAYAFTPDGGILGIGTHDGIATAFIVYV